MQPIHRIQWRDAHDVGAGTWVDPTAQSFTSMAITSIGWIVHEDNDVVVLASTLAEGGEVRGAFVIPKSAIRARDII